MAETALRHSPLHERHLAAGAKLSEFAGWELPLNYEAGTLAEHKACREDAVAFDVSHLGTLLVRGGAAEAVLQWCFTNDLGRISPGRAQYTHLLDRDEAWVIDDIIVWWQETDLFRVLPNAANTEEVAAVLRGAADEMPEGLPGEPVAGGAGGQETDGAEAGDAAGKADIEVTDITVARALIAVQGPRARERLAAVAPAAADVARFGVDSFSFEGETCYAAGTGYTGEDGVECEVPAAAAPHFWDALQAAGVLPAGLGARDTLRLEAGFPLHGHELGLDITPVNARLNWVVGWDKPAFRGKEALVAQRTAGVARRILGLVGASRRPMRAGQEVKWEGRHAGELTSGGFSPSLECGIALAMLAANVPIGAEVEVGDRALKAQVVKPPFVGHS